MLQHAILAASAPAVALTILTVPAVEKATYMMKNKAVLVGVSACYYRH